MKVPGRDHPITVEPYPRRVRVSLHGEVLADSDRVLCLREASIPPVFYFPPDDVNMTFLKPSKHSTHCPYKGDACYYHAEVGAERRDNIVWYYPEAYPAVGDIAGYMAFYSSKVDRIEELE